MPKSDTGKAEIAKTEGAAAEGAEAAGAKRARACREPAFVPFADACAVRTIGSLCFENGPATIALHGALDLTRDRTGLDRARSLKSTVDAIVAALEAAELPQAVAEVAVAPGRAKNPFA